MAEVDVRQDLVDSFKEVCAVDEVKARQYLNHCDGDIETAVQLFFQTGGTLQNTHEGVNNADNVEREQATRRPPPAPPAQRGNTWWDLIVTIVSLPFRFTISTIWEIISVFSGMFLQRRPALTDPVGDVERFISGYNEKVPANSPFRIDFYHGSFEDAARFAKTNLRLMLVYVHHPNHKDSVKFVNDVLHSSQISDLIRANDLLVWGVSATSAQGRVVSSFMRSDGAPLLGLITIRNNRPTLGLRLSGVLDPDSVAVNLRLACEDFQQQLNVLRMQKAQREENQRIREEQEREYQESAAKDRARIQERRRLESEKADAEERERKKIQEAEDRKKLLESRQEEFRASEVTEPQGTDVVRIQIRFPSGARLDRRFNPDDSLEGLFEAAFSHTECPLYFSVFTNYPRKELFCAPTWYHEILSTQLAADGMEVSKFTPARTFREEGLERSFVVMIQDCMA